MRTHLKTAFAAVVLAGTVSAPAMAQNIDMSSTLPMISFPKEGVDRTSETAKKLPREETFNARRNGILFFLTRENQTNGPSNLNQ
jgi:hypothetical protein